MSSFFFFPVWFWTAWKVALSQTDLRLGQGDWSSNARVDSRASDQLDNRYHPFIIRQDKDLVGELHHGGWKSGAGTFLQAIALCKSWKYYHPTHLGFEMPSHGREDENRKNESRLWWGLNLKQLRKKWTTLNFLISYRMINLNYKEKN